MKLRLAFGLVLLSLLTACGPDPRQAEICELVLPALLADGETPGELAASADPRHARSIVLAFRADGVRHQATCQFGGNRVSPARLSLRQIFLDGAPLSFPRMVFIWRAYGLTPPVDLVDGAPAPAPMTPWRAAAYFAQQLVNGLTIGAVLGLIAVGYSLVYGVTGTIQFAFGEMFMIGGYLMAILLATLVVLGLGFLPALLLLALVGTVLVSAVYGWTIDRLVYRPLRSAGPLPPLIAAIGLSIALREYVRLAQGAGNRWLPDLLPARLTFFDGDGFTVSLGAAQVAILLLALGVTAALAWFVLRTSAGRAQRACADDPVMAALLGVDVDRTIATTFALGAVLAALAGLVVALYYGEVDPYVGYLFGFKALTAALLGGFGSISGALLGGLVLGLFDAFWSGYLGTEYKDAAIFSLLILVLIFRPQGLLGTATNPRDAGALLPAR
jgi:branched-chain amino acid transport system permease protein